MKRISKDQYALALAFTAALRSEDPHLKVGAVALTKEARVIACAYNGLAAGVNPPAKFWKDRDAKSKYMIHAEMNLCALFKRGEVHTIACTHSPCPACARVMAAAGVRRVIFGTLYDRDPSAVQILSFHNIQIQHIKTSHA